MTIKGFDVSYWQKSTPSLVGYDFAFARAAYGTGQDTRYDMHAANIKASGAVLGAYLFGIDSFSGAAQAHALLSIARDADLLALDIEGANQMNAAQARAFFATIHAAGRKCGLYHSLSGFSSLGQDFNWVAAWGYSSLPIKWTFWQWGGKNGIDQDTFKGTLADLNTLAGRTTAGPSGDIMTRFANANGLDLMGRKLVTLPPGTQLNYLDGAVFGKTGVEVTVPSLGIADAIPGHRLIVTPTAGPYSDGVARATVLVAIGGIESDAPPAVIPVPVDVTPFGQSDIDAAVAAQKTADDEACAARETVAIAVGTGQERARLRSVLGI